MSPIGNLCISDNHPRGSRGDAPFYYSARVFGKVGVGHLHGDFDHFLGLRESPADR